MDQRYPVNKILMQRLNSAGTGTATTVITIPETIAEHNVALELLRYVRNEWPGAWFRALEMDRDGRLLDHPKKIGNIPSQTDEVVGKMKTVTREALGLPPDDPIGDMPQ